MIVWLIGKKVWPNLSKEQVHEVRKSVPGSTQAAARKLYRAARVAIDNAKKMNAEDGCLNALAMREIASVTISQLLDSQQTAQV